MKKLLFIFIAFTALMTGCKKASIKTYEGKDAIYFLLPFASVNPADSMNISFALGGPNLTDSILKIPVRISGSPVSIERLFQIKYEDSSTAIKGVHYVEPSRTAVAGNAVTDTIMLKVRRTEEMKTQSFVLYLTLVDNNNFVTPIKSKVLNSLTGQVLHYTQMKIIINDILAKPQYWLDAYLGTFSRKKVYLMSQVLGISVESIALNKDIGTEQFWGKYMKLYLEDQKANGTPVYEEDGITLMSMGTSIP